jgi:hypothetical protein
MTISSIVSKTRYESKRCLVVIADSWQHGCVSNRLPHQKHPSGCSDQRWALYTLLRPNLCAHDGLLVLNGCRFLQVRRHLDHLMVLGPRRSTRPDEVFSNCSKLFSLQFF